MSARSLLPRAPLLSACIALCGCLAANAQATPTWLPAQNLSIAGVTAPAGIRPVVSMGPNGDIATAWTEAGYIVVSLRKAGSERPVVELVSIPADISTSPNVAIDSAGEVVVAWIDRHKEQYEIALRKPGGVFSAPIPAGPTSAGNQARPSLAIDSAGDVLLGETVEKAGTYVSIYAWRPAGGLFAEATVSETGNEGSAPVVALDEAGDAVVAWWEHVSAGASPTIARAITRPAGGSFGSAQTLSSASEYAFAIAAAIGVEGQPAVAWQRGTTSPPYRIEASTSAGPTEPLSTAQTISPAGGSDTAPAIAVGGNGEVLTAWEQRGATQTEDLASATAGAGFGPAIEASANGSVGAPSVAMDAAGDAVIAWAAAPEGEESVRALTRAAAGTLAPEITLSTPGERVDLFASEGVSAAMDSPGDAVVGWEHFAEHFVQARIYDATGPALKLEAPVSGVVGQPVTFKSIAKDLFSGVLSIGWSFGDGTGTEGTGPTHTYTAPGTYTVTATAADGVGNTTGASAQVVIAPAPSVVCACGPPPCRIVPLGVHKKGCGAWEECLVPHLLGLSRQAAARRLAAARCKLGKVTIAKRYRHAKRLVVSVQRVKAAAELADGSKVAITLKPPPPPPPRHRHKRRR
jgi:hypothetical protein